MKAHIWEPLLNHIANEIDKTNFGEIKIELSDNKQSIDVVTTSRKRFFKEEEKSPPAERIVHEG